MSVSLTSRAEHQHHRPHRQRPRGRRYVLLVSLAGLALLLCGLLPWVSACAGSPPDQGAASVSATASTSRPSDGGVAQARAVHANEMGEIPVLMYHLIGQTKSQYNRSPAEFRQDLAALEAGGYYPINARDLARGDIDVPAGRSPVVLTFDDSSGGQYRIRPDGSLDPDCAVGIMQAAVAAGGWRSRASFFPLLDVDVSDREVFGQADLKEKKLKQLVAWGYEVGSHTVSHLDLRKASANQARKQLWESEDTLQQMIGDGYRVTTLAVPFGSYPAQASLLMKGEYQGHPYSYTAALAVTGGPSPSPFSAKFRPAHINRLQVTGDSLKTALANLAKHPELRYVSDGDPKTIAVPQSLPPQLGDLRAPPGRVVVRY